MTKDEILSRLLSDISDEFDKGVGSFFYDVTKPASEEFETAYARLEEILKNGFALTASGEYLDFKAAEQGITKKSGVASQVKVTITGTPGSVISVGDKVASDNLIFSAIENKEINESGTADVTIICDAVGTVGNIPTGSINRFPVTLSGIVSVTNNELATGGFNEESDDELRDRYFEKVSLPATSGSKYHYIQWAKEISGVGDTKCLPLWNGNGTVKVIIINSEKGVASDELIDEVKTRIEENRPIGAEVTVESAEPLTIDVSVTLTLSNGASIDVAKEKITESITNYLRKNAFAISYISYAQISELFSACVNENARKKQSQDAYTKKYNSLVRRYERSEKRLNKATAEREDKVNKERELRLFFETLKNKPQLIHIWDENLWITLVEKMEVSHDKMCTVFFKNGISVKVDI